MKELKVTIEGVAGSGKTSFMLRLAEFLGKEGYQYEIKDEPDASPEELYNKLVSEETTKMLKETVVLSLYTKQARRVA